MSKVKISALGALSDEAEFELLNDAERLGDLVMRTCGIPENEARLCYVVNESIQKADYLPSDGDKVVLLKMGGAG